MNIRRTSTQRHQTGSKAILSCDRKFEPLVFGDIQAAGDTVRSSKRGKFAIFPAPSGPVAIRGVDQVLSDAPICVRPKAGMREVGVSHAPVQKFQAC
jgi:hypothetical protein